MPAMMSVLQRLSSSPPQKLRILQPTHATVSYVVSTRPAANTIPTILSLCICLALRFLTSLLLLLLLEAKWRASSEDYTGILPLLLTDARREWLAQLIQSLQWIYLAPGALFMAWLTLKRPYTEESLTVLRSLGLQISTTSSLYFRTPNTRFIPTTSIQDIFIYEAFKGFEVRFYLAVVVKGEENVVVVFPKLLPKRKILEEVWRGARACLHESTGPKKRYPVQAAIDQ